MTGPFRAGWQMDYPLIQNFLQPLYYTNASSNDGKWTQRGVRQARRTRPTRRPTRPRRSSTFQEAEKVVRDHMPAIPLWYQNGSAGYSERLTTWR